RKRRISQQNPRFPRAQRENLGDASRVAQNGPLVAAPGTRGSNFWPPSPRPGPPTSAPALLRPDTARRHRPPAPPAGTACRHRPPTPARQALPTQAAPRRLRPSPQRRRAGARHAALPMLQRPRLAGGRARVGRAAPQRNRAPRRDRTWLAAAVGSPGRSLLAV